MKKWSEPPSLEQLNKSYGELFAADLSLSIANALHYAIKNEFEAPFYTKYLAVKLPLLIAKFIYSGEKKFNIEPYKKLCDSLHDMSPLQKDFLKAYVKNKCDDGDIEPCSRVIEMSRYFSENVGDFGLLRELVRTQRVYGTFSVVSIKWDCRHLFDMCGIADQLSSMSGAIT